MKPCCKSQGQFKFPAEIDIPLSDQDRKVNTTFYYLIFDKL